jgi:hypothetical protein
MDQRIKDNWAAVKASRATTTFRVDFGVGDLAKVVGTVIGLPVALIALMIAGAFVAENSKPCGYIDRERIDPITGEIVQSRGAVFVPRDQPCPPGTIPP